MSIDVKMPNGLTLFQQGKDTFYNPDIVYHLTQTQGVTGLTHFYQQITVRAIFFNHTRVF